MDEERLLALLREGCRLNETKYHLSVQILSTRDFRRTLSLATDFLACDIAEDGLNLELLESYPEEAAETGLVAVYGRSPEESCRNLLNNIAVKLDFLLVLEQAEPGQAVRDLNVEKLVRAVIRRIREYARQYLVEVGEHRE